MGAHSNGWAPYLTHNITMLKIERNITGVIDEVLTLDEVKNFLKVDYDTEDTLLTDLMDQSRDILEQFLSRSILASDVTLTVSKRDEVILPYAPIDTIDSITDQDGDPIEYTYDELSIKLVSTDTFTIDYYTLTDLPPGLKLGLLETIAYLYENRGDISGIGLILYYNKNLQPFRNRVWI